MAPSSGSSGGCRVALTISATLLLPYGVIWIISS